MNLNPVSSEADALLIAAKLLEALKWHEQFHMREGEDHNDCFERIAEVFHRETGYLRPGKDCRVDSIEVRQAAWGKWIDDGITRTRAAISRATGASNV